ncbi:ABC transporter related protein [Meiothermus taiwanensis WR-220]|uniref:Lipoprotein-releasing system ATP-binding protein LolD n=2 Tax=Meiothermus taiwanensis TaxID=172827 RepID=A0A399DV16_9DEIN|nr:ABC transporter related protein [Meiothermus taiwanensis WR-220]RIH76025.1 Lipoprotein-releasing system ATP-binding protein LolD [Meiothermus taiwanensis]
MLEVSNLSFSYDEVGLFQNLSFTLDTGQVRVILGPSGSGKTTLLHLLAGLLHIQQGDIRWQGQSIRGQSEEALAQRRLRFTGLVFQHHYLQAELTALENILVPGYLAGAVDIAWGRELLQRIGLLERAHLRPQALSGGERQRIAVARALYNRPKLLLADEPTGSLDRRNAERIWELMLSLAQDLGTAVIVATHDEHLVRGLPELRLG